MAVKSVKSLTKAEERAIIERRFAKRILADHSAAMAEWTNKVWAISHDAERIDAWIREHGMPCTIHEAGNGLGYASRVGENEYVLLTYKRARECAEREAGPEPSLSKMLLAVAEPSGAVPR